MTSLAGGIRWFTTTKSIKLDLTKCNVPDFLGFIAGGGGGYDIGGLAGAVFTTFGGGAGAIASPIRKHRI